MIKSALIRCNRKPQSNRTALSRLALPVRAYTGAMSSSKGASAPKLSRSLFVAPAHPLYNNRIQARSQSQPRPFFRTVKPQSKAQPFVSQKRHLSISQTARSPQNAPPHFHYQDIYEMASPDTTPYRKISSDGIKPIKIGDRTGIEVSGEAITRLTAEGFMDIEHLLRPAHLQQLSNILKDPEASDNDRFVAMELLKNANIAAGKILPGCQDTGTAIISAKKGQFVITDGKDAEHITRGVYNTFTQANLRYSQMAPLSMFEEVNTKSNLPAQIDLYATDGDAYKFQFIAKGGGSANKTFYFNKTKQVLKEENLLQFLGEEIKHIGTSACPPYHLAVVIGGTSAEAVTKATKLASTKYFDNLHTSGNQHGRGFRDLEWEDKLLKLTQQQGIGAQFGGKYFCHDVRVIRLPRHGASCPIGIGVSCSADRQALGKITNEGVFLEQLETDPAKYMPDVDESKLSQEVVHINLDEGMQKTRETLSKFPVTTRLALSGTLVVARDVAHAKILDRINQGGGMPDYLKQYPVYYAGPAKTPEGYASGSFGPTTAGRMDPYVEKFQELGGSMVMLAKGNRGKAVTKACKQHGGFYLGSVGGPAARAAQRIHNIEVLEYPELGMEAVWKIQVENFPAFIIVDDKGNDFFSKFF